MRHLIIAASGALVGLGMAVSAQAAPSTSLAPLSTLSQSPIEQVQYGHRRCTKRVTRCRGYGRHRHCERVCVRWGGHH